MDPGDQPQQPRLLQNPHLAECPDFGGPAFDILVQSMVGPDRTAEQVVENLKTAWHADNNRKKALWDAQTRADQERQAEPNAQNAAAANRIQNDDAGLPPSKAQLGAFSATASIGSKRSLKPSAFAINKLKERKYIELYCFSPAGCRDHANQRLSTADEALGFTYGISSSDPNNASLFLKPLSALSHPGKVIPDSELTWEQVRDAKACYLNHVSLAGWDMTHVQALVAFFVNLDSHPYNVSPDGKQALVWYQAHAREDWHRKLGTAESYNLALLNEDLLAEFKKEASDLSIQNHVSQVSTPFCYSFASFTNPHTPHLTLTHLAPVIPPTSHVRSSPQPHAPCTPRFLTPAHPHAPRGTSFAPRCTPRTTLHPMPHAAPPRITRHPFTSCNTPRTTRHPSPCTMRIPTPHLTSHTSHPPIASHHQLNKRIDSLAARASTTDHHKPHSRSKSGRYQPYNTDIGADAAGRNNDETSRSSRSVSSNKRHKVGNRQSSPSDHPLSGGTEPRGLSACAICLGRNPHDVSQCAASLLWDNHTPVFAKKGDKGAKLRVASSGDSLCLDWNLPRSCGSSSHLARHRCSGCGSDDHGAQSCRLAQPKS